LAFKKKKQKKNKRMFTKKICSLWYKNRQFYYNMASAPQSGQSGDAGKRQALIGVNDLNYVLPPDLSVSVVRTHTNHYFQQSEYTDKQRSICILNTGAHYIDTRQSSLEFGVRLTNNGTNDFGGYLGRNGTALNLIDSITVTSRAGDELCRLDQADLLHYVTTPFRQTGGWMNTVGQSMGLGGICISPDEDQNTTHFSIPLYALVDLFNYGRLIPPMLASGLRISITWTAPARAFIIRRNINAAKTAATILTDFITEYTIENPYISTFAHQLSDGIQRDLNELSATNGLEIVYCDWEPTEITYNATNNLSAQLEVRKAASRALQAIAVTRNTANINDKDADSYATMNFDYAKYQWQLGSLYFPQQPVIANGTVGATGGALARNAGALAETFKHTLISFGKYKPEGGAATAAAVPFRNSGTYLLDIAAQSGLDTVAANTPWGEEATDPGDYVGVVGSPNGKWGTFCNGMSVLGVQLERTDLFNMSGVPINNARVLSLRTTYEAQDAPAVGRTLTIFLKYVRLARCFLNNVEVEQ
jgi:hypothetical protein